MPETFAPDFERTEEGWIKFPRDIEYRRKWFPNKNLDSKHDVFAHPAKMQMYLVEEVLKYLSKPGDWVLDPFGGTGTSALSVREGRNCILIDVEEEFGEIIKESITILAPGGSELLVSNEKYRFPTWHYFSDKGELRLLIGDNRQVLKQLKDQVGQLIDLVITSPPYSTALNPGSNPLEVKGREGTLAQYSRSPFNLSRMNPFVWEQAMRGVWEGCAGVMKSGAKLVVVNKDIVKSGQRELLGAALVRQGNASGFKYREWYKWAPPGTIRQETARNKGGTVIEDEDIIIFERV